MSLTVHISNHTVLFLFCNSQQKKIKIQPPEHSQHYRFSKKRLQSVVHFPDFHMRTVWSVHALTYNYYDYNLIWKWWLTLKVCQRVVEWRLYGWRCLWVKTPVNPVCTVANRGGWSQTKQLLHSLNEVEHSNSLCKCIWGVWGLGVYVGGVVIPFPFL